MEIAELDALFDSYSPYEIAVLTFTSPREVEMSGNRETSIVLTGKDAYIWAGAVAHILVRNPELNAERVRGFFFSAIQDNSPRMRELLQGNTLRRFRYAGSELSLVQTFLRNAGVSDDLDMVIRRTEDAMRSLEWRGHIEDPFKKKMGTILLSVALLMPVGFTSKGSDEVEINALTWEYVKRGEGDHAKREIRLKVRETTELILHELVPGFVHAIDTLSHSSDAERINIREVQSKLSRLGYYRGSIDGKVGPQTITALRQFQQEYYLEATGYLDPHTVRRLKSV